VYLLFFLLNATRIFTLDPVNSVSNYLGITALAQGAWPVYLCTRSWL